jgi:hypothetical protein
MDNKGSANLFNPFNLAVIFLWQSAASFVVIVYETDEERSGLGLLVH